MKNYFTHKTAIIDDDTKIGKGSKIWAFSHISEGAVIGKNCMIGEGVHIGRNVVLGNNCKVQNHSLLYEGVTLEDDVFIGPNVITTNDLYPRAFGEWDHRFKKTLIKKGVGIGANSTIVCGVTLHEYAMVAAGSVVTKDVMKKSLVKGNPARHDRFMNDVDSVFAACYKTTASEPVQ
jgi:UDP-2-acetamido-3-amino-2,3-dideoxy-glucuronate N-acetyltransferase